VIQTDQLIAINWALSIKKQPIADTLHYCIPTFVQKCLKCIKSISADKWSVKTIKHSMFMEAAPVVMKYNVLYMHQDSCGWIAFQE
jgi:hypothetical protein